MLLKLTPSILALTLLAFVEIEEFSVGIEDHFGISLNNSKKKGGKNKIETGKDQVLEHVCN